MSSTYQIYIESQITEAAKLYRVFVHDSDKICFVSGYLSLDPHQKIHSGQVSQIFKNGKAKIHVSDDLSIYTERSFKGKNINVGEKVWVQSNNNSVLELAYKDPKGTLNIALPCGPIILYPFDSGIYISQRLKQYPEFAHSLKQHFEAMAGRFGIKFRLASKDYSFALLKQVISFVKTVWDQNEYNKIEFLVFNQLLNYFLFPTEIFTNDPEIERWFQKSFGNIFEIPLQIKPLPQDTEILEDAWSMACRLSVPLPSGGVLFLQETLGCLVIDVNAGADSSLENVNREAIKILPHFLVEGRFGGKVVVDLLPTANYSEREQLCYKFYEAFQMFDVQVQLYGISKMGLLEFILPRRGYPLWWIDKQFNSF
jgi:hypothetical protein